MPRRRQCTACFGNRFKAWCVQAGLPHCSAHGLRKAGTNRVLENGATEYEAMAIHGWDSPKQAALYALHVNRKKLADSAMDLLDPDYKANESVPLESVVRSGGTKRGKKP